MGIEFPVIGVSSPDGLVQGIFCPFSFYDGDVIDCCDDQFRSFHRGDDVVFQGVVGKAAVALITLVSSAGIAYRKGDE